MQQQFEVVIERDEEGYYIASVPQLPMKSLRAFARRSNFASKSRAPQRESFALAANPLRDPHSQLGLVADGLGGGDLFRLCNLFRIQSD